MTQRWGDLPLVCPRCRQVLAGTADEVSCEVCGARYPAENGILRLVIGRVGAPSYDPHYFATLERIEDRHFWFVARRGLVVDCLRRAVADLHHRHLFDIGCGTGRLVEYIAAQGVPVAGACDAYSESLEVFRRRLEVPLVLVDEGRLPPLGPGHDLLSLFDVLEHVEDDGGLLSFLHSILVPDGVLVLTVPAHPFLYDERDRLACHRRRYRRNELREKLERAGFEVRLLTHFMAPLVPPLVAMRLLGLVLPDSPRRGRGQQDVEFRVTPLVNGLMGWLLGWERRLLRAISLPFGSSIIAVAARRGGAS